MLNKTPQLKLELHQEQQPKRKRGRPRTNDGDCCCPQLAELLAEMRPQIIRTRAAVEQIARDVNWFQREKS